MKYKLIKEYPGSPKLNSEIIQSENNKNLYFSEKFNNFPIQNPEKYKEFWQEVFEKDYEILEIQGKYGSISSYKEQYDSDLKDKSIYKIKRLSDSIVFRVGDEVLSKTCSVPNKILSIEIINNKIRLYPRNSFYNLEDIKKVKQLLFTTEDKINIYLGDESWILHKNTWTLSNTPTIHNNSNWKQIGESAHWNFSTKEKAEEYILMHKPCLSIQDIHNISSIYYLGKNMRRPSASLLKYKKNDLKELVKQKLNK
jgi:hypothetical protein